VTADYETGGHSLIKGDAQAGKVVANFGSHQHTAVVGPAFAYGPGSKLVMGLYPSTDFYFRFKQALGWQ
jgi:alkaline phosphatase